ncbi:MAG: cystathionine gamma-synthase [Methylobacteriaceae bacterium]|jgi:cystathionine gamma-lyase|nr:cystathionine gamma-synthase [Methylobacteriaceae bacterium]
MTHDSIKTLKFATRAIRAGEEPDFREGASGDVVAPIHLSTTFARRIVEQPTGGYEYTRSLNPTRKALETRLAALENGAHAMAFSSGLAAETTVLVSLVKAGGHIIALDDLYGGTRRLFSQVFNGYGITASYVGAADVGEMEAAITPATRLIWLESPSNPLMKLCDIAAAAKLARRRGLVLVVDNTFLTPYFQNPLDLGADIVVHSMTKYIGGHSDVLGGAVIVNDEALYQRLAFNQNAVGAVLPPFDCYLTLRGLKTLALRMERHQQNALAVARFLEAQPLVKRVYYPGLESHPQHELAKRQASGFGGVLSFELEGTLATSKAFLENLDIFALAESLGGVESLIELPSLMTHASVDAEARAEIGITDTLIRVSVGIEDIDDLLADLERALSAAARVVSTV